MSKLRALAFSTYMAVDTLLIGMMSLPALLNRNWAVGISKFWVRTLEWGLRTIGGIHKEVVGLENLPDGPAIIASKHQSMWETLALNQALSRPAYVLKKELGRIPVFGWWTSACGFIYVDRTAGAAALKKMVADAEHAIAEGKSHIVIFPEGTRVKPGETGRYQPGIAALAKALNLPIVPVAHNSGCHWRHHDGQMIPGTITMEFGVPIPPDMSRAELMRSLEGWIEPTTRALETQYKETHGPDTAAMETS